MPLPRFHRLEPQRQAQILDAAAGEFGMHGYGNASMNRIIEAAGLSKGAMYYYFDGKADLWGTLVDASFEELGPLDALFEGADSVGGFWAGFRGMYASAWSRAAESPRLASMMRAMTLSSQTDDAMQLLAGAQGMENLRASFGRLLAIGQQLGAVRRDLSEDQLLELVLAVNMVTDRWVALATYDEAASIPALLDTIVDLNVRLLESRS